MKCIRELIEKKKRPERGFVAIEFVASMALLLTPCALLVLSVPTAYERINMANQAAREAAREVVLSGNPASGATAVARVEGNYSLPNQQLTLQSIDGDPSVRGARITAVIGTTIPTINIPILDIGLPEIAITARHSELVDLYRSQR